MPLPARATALLTAARLPREPWSDAWHPASGADPTEPIPAVAGRPEEPRRRPPEAAAGVRGADVVFEASRASRGAGRPARDDVGSPGRGVPGRAGPSVSARDTDGDADADVVALPSRHLVRASDGVLQIPRGLQGARVSPPWAAVVGAAVVVIVAVAVVLVAVLRDAPEGEPVPTRPTHADPAGRATSFSATASPPPSAAGTRPPDAAAPVPSPTQAAPDLVVHVIGEVGKPGVVAVPAGARVKDAIAEAGGATRRAVLTGVNLARPVVDGEQILVPDSENAPIPVNTLPAPTTTAGGPAASSGQVDLNSADQATLEQLPGVGPVLALRILEWRAAHGRFTSVDELGEVSGVGEKKLESLRPHVRV